MHAVELALPAVVTLTKAMGSEGFGGGVGITTEEVQFSESDHVSVIVSPSIDTCNSLLNQKGESCAVYTSETAFFSKIPDVDLCSSISQLSSLHGEGMPDLGFENTNSSLVRISESDSKQIQPKSGKAVRSNSGSKRSRMAYMEVSVNETPADDMKNVFNEVGSVPTNCSIADKTQTAKRISNLNGKRGDKRNGKFPKFKYDSLSLKAGWVSFGSAPRGNSFTDINDVTKHVDEPSLNELLDGNYKCPSFAKDEGKNAGNLNENILHLVRGACSVLQLQKQQPQFFAETDDGYIQKVSTSPLNSGSSVGGRSNTDKGDTCTADLSSCNKDSCGKLEIHTNILDFPLHQPQDILERLSLPPSKDLESLLIDAAKPAISSRNNPDLRVGKPTSQRGALPPFSWSHTFGGHFKSNLDAVKISASRSTCHGRWVKIGNSASFLGDSTGFLEDLESLTYNHSLVPWGDKKSGPLGNENVSSTSVSFSSHDLGISSSASCPIAGQVPPAGHSPRLLAAAQTLYDMANGTLMQHPHGPITWTKRFSQMAVKACNLKSNANSENILAAKKSAMRLDNMVKTASETVVSKKPRLSLNEKFDGFRHNDAMRKRLVIWSTPKSSGLSPYKSFEDLVAEKQHDDPGSTPKSSGLSPYKSFGDLVAEKQHDDPDIVKKSFMTPSFSRASAKGCHREQKSRKLVRMEWNGGDRSLD